MPGEARELPDHGYWDGCYYDKTNHIEGYELHSRDIVKIVTPLFDVTPPDRVIFEQINATTDKWTMVTTIDGQTYTKEYIIRLTGRGTDSEAVQSMTLPTGKTIQFVNV